MKHIPYSTAKFHPRFGIAMAGALGAAGLGIFAPHQPGLMAAGLVALAFGVALLADRAIARVTMPSTSSEQV